MIRQGRKGGTSLQDQVNGTGRGGSLGVFITTDISLFPMPWALIEVVGWGRGLSEPVWLLEAAVAICILELGLCC